jgi:FkbH-like protein
MVLKEEHIATAQINWQDKATNLRQIALDLNIGLDSIVFMDDSEFEINLIRQTLPEVEVVHLPKDRAVEYRHILASCGLFDTITVSEEDKKRGAMYKREVNRKQLKVQATDMISYYRSLEMIAEIRFADELAIPRIAQQTQRTNQFNLTTRRYNEADIKHFIENPESDVIYLKLSDRFGDSGIVGTCILRYEKKKAFFDTFLLSCRVLGRGVEEVLIGEALRLAKMQGCELAVGEYYATPKNLQVENFYADQGFAEVNCNEGRSDRVFHFNLKQAIPEGPGYYKEIRSNIKL